MIIHLYRISHGNRIGYALRKNGRFYFVNLQDPNYATSEQDSASETDCKILTPTQPSKIIGIGLNYSDHAAERKKPLPAEPLIFLKPPSALRAHEETIHLPAASQRVDPEGELAIVIRKTAKKLSSSQHAKEYIWGYSCFNDVTARDLQDKDVQFSRAKGFDTFAPYGPCLALGVEPDDLSIQTRVNGNVRQTSRTSKLIFSPDYLVWYVSNIMTLVAGDVIATGTPGGIAPVQAGDEVEVEIESVGLLRNRVKAD
jgi:2-keto-4-pentenoate hydratase/2-oxohepta-3-ene-1,7-dioic acid hydratase in catechol pathway